MTEFSNRIKNLIANDQLDLALDELEKHANSIKDKHINQIAILKGNLKDIKTRATLGVLDIKEEQLLLNKIRLSIVQTLESIESYNPNVISQNKKYKKHLFAGLLSIIILITIGIFLSSKNEIQLSTLFEIIESPIQNKEGIILSKGFSSPTQIDYGKSYSRNNETEFIENWDNGVVRYITTNEKNHLRIKKQIEQEDYKYINEYPNNKGDLIFNYEKGSKKISIGSFSTAQMYLIVASDTTKEIEIKPYIEGKDIFGSWGRIQELGKEGNYTFNEDYSFTYTDSESGTIKGEWHIDRRELVIKYNYARDKRFSFESAHPFSNKTEIIKITNKTPPAFPNEISGEVQGEIDIMNKVILKRR